MNLADYQTPKRFCSLRVGETFRYGTQFGRKIGCRRWLPDGGKVAREVSGEQNNAIVYVFTPTIDVACAPSYSSRNR